MGAEDRPSRLECKPDWNASVSINKSFEVFEVSLKSRGHEFLVKLLKGGQITASRHQGGQGG